MKRVNYILMGVVLVIMVGIVYANAETPEVYDPAGKIDPFAPLFKAKSKKAETKVKAKVVRKNQFIPLCKWELNQLDLTATIVGTEHRFASWVIPGSGQTYSARVGDYVGSEGYTITEIGLGYVIMSNRETIKTK